MKYLNIFLVLCFITAPLASAQAGGQESKDSKAVQAEMNLSNDEQGVHDAVQDYLEGIYQVKPEWIERSVSKNLVKFGYWRENAEQAYSPSPMNYDQLYRLASGWNANNRNKIDENSHREIVVLDVLDKTAAAKLTAFWGIDYFQLEKIDGKWMIRHVLWQAHPIPSDH